ncbi:MAG: pheST operon leader peptide PheM [Candidatus Symbiopectobacterium sp. Dall1.0]|nr:pheST operon leader peptide PheM [Candidatus Symbiopectobacterium sp. Dall1.0]
MTTAIFRFFFYFSA